MKDILTDATKLFPENNDHMEFKFMYCFVKLQDNKKWERTQIDLSNGHGTRGPANPAFPAPEGCPIGNKKAKSDKASAASVQASIEKCLADVTDMSKQNASIFADRLSSLMS